jgi:hypothetical protein
MASSGVKVTLMIPLADNDGEPFDLWTWDWWSDRLLAVV